MNYELRIMHYMKLIWGGKFTTCLRSSYYKANYTNLLVRRDGHQEEGVIIKFK